MLDEIAPWVFIEVYIEPWNIGFADKGTANNDCIPQCECGPLGFVLTGGDLDDVEVTLDGQVGVSRGFVDQCFSFQKWQCSLTFVGWYAI